MPANTTLDLPPIPANAAMTLGGFLEEVSTRYADREAVAFYDPLKGGDRVSWNYAELRRQARAITKGLIAAGVGKGARIGVLLGNRPEFVAALFGIASAGAVPVTLSTFSTRDELATLLECSDVELILSQSTISRRSLVGDLSALLENTSALGASPRFPFLRGIIVPGLQSDPRFTSWENFLARGSEISESMVDARLAHVSENDEGAIIYTSGTTSLPKGVIHLHSTIIKQFTGSPISMDATQIRALPRHFRYSGRRASSRCSAQR